MQKKTIFLTQSALIAAVYIILTYVASLLGIASGSIQFRLSEALTILPYFTPAAIPGLFVGCLLSNLLTGCALWDVVFGSFATLIGAVLTYLLRQYKWLAPVPPILSNVLIMPFVLRAVYGVENAVPYLMLTIGIGEVVTCGVLGMILLLNLQRYSNKIFR